MCVLCLGNTIPAERHTHTHLQVLLYSERGMKGERKLGIWGGGGVEIISLSSYLIAGHSSPGILWRADETHRTTNTNHSPLISLLTNSKHLPLYPLLSLSLPLSPASPGRLETRRLYYNTGGSETGGGEVAD